MDGDVHRTRLPHGLEVVTERVPSSRTFSVGVFARVGSRQESAARHGASHFLEHVLFKGTPTRTAEQISAAVESVGGELNAYTAKEHTCFYARVRAGDAAVAAGVLTDMIAASLIRSRDVEAERAVILDEIAMHADDPGEVAHELLAGALFGATQLGKPVIGSPRSISDLSREQIVRHWRRHYQPASLVVAAAGQLDHDEVVAQFAGLDDRPVQAQPAAERPHLVLDDAPLVLGATRGVEQTTAVLGFRGVGVFDDLRYPLGLLSVVVGGGMASRLFVEVRERRGLSYGIEAGELAYSDAGLWSVDWQCAPDRLEPILDVVRATLVDLAEHGVTDAELIRAKGQMRGQTELGYESPASRMTRLGGNAVLGDERTLTEVLTRFDAVTSEEVREAAVGLVSQPPVLAVVGPELPARSLELAVQQW